MRTTRKIAPNADVTHITMVSAASAATSQFVITIGRALYAVICTTSAPMPEAIAKPTTALISA